MNEYKVLLDLSTTLSGKFSYSGVPQEARILFKIFSTMDEVFPTGLICGENYTATYKVKSLNNKVKQSLNYVNYFLALEEPQLRSIWNKLSFYFKSSQRVLKRVLLDTNYTLHKVNEEYHDFIWRKAFNNAIDPIFKNTILKQNFVLSNFNKFILRTKLNFNLPLPSLDTRGADFVIFQSGLPLMPTVSPGTIPIIRFHDFIPLKFPDMVANLFYSRSYAKGVLSSARNGSIFVCNSQPVSEELITFLPSLEKRTYVIPPPLFTEGGSVERDTVERDTVERDTRAIPAIFATYRARIKTRIRTIEGALKWVENPLETQFNPFSQDCSNYIISVSTLEPRKNFISLISAWEKVRYVKDNQLKLVIVGAPGWKCKPILDNMKSYVFNGDIIYLANVPAEELKMLYAGARAFVFPTYYEGFGSTPVEAIHAGCPVIVSDIPTTRWVLGDAALYCNPYDINSIADAIERLLYSSESQELRHALVKKGFDQIKKYSSEEVGKQWINLFHKLKSNS